MVAGESSSRLRETVKLSPSTGRDLRSLTTPQLVWRALKVPGVHELKNLPTAYDDPYSPAMRGVEFGDSAYKAFEHFWKIKEHNNGGYFNIFGRIYKRKQLSFVIKLTCSRRTYTT